jgi:hypothetical protein
VGGYQNGTLRNTVNLIHVTQGTICGPLRTFWFRKRWEICLLERLLSSPEGICSIKLDKSLYFSFHTNERSHYWKTSNKMSWSQTCGLYLALQRHVIYFYSQPFMRDCAPSIWCTYDHRHSNTHCDPICSRVPASQIYVHMTINLRIMEGDCIKMGQFDSTVLTFRRIQSFSCVNIQSFRFPRTGPPTAHLSVSISNLIPVINFRRTLQNVTAYIDIFQNKVLRGSQ